MILPIPSAEIELIPGKIYDLPEFCGDLACQGRYVGTYRNDYLDSTSSYYLFLINSTFHKNEFWLCRPIIKTRKNIVEVVLWPAYTGKNLQSMTRCGPGYKGDVWEETIL